MVSGALRAGLSSLSRRNGNRWSSKEIEAAGCCWLADETIRTVQLKRIAQDRRKRLSELRISDVPGIEGIVLSRISDGTAFSCPGFNGVRARMAVSDAAREALAR